MEKKTYFITGVAGFIGSNTAETLLRQGHSVVGFDNLAPVYSPEKKLNNIEKVRQWASAPTDFQFFQGDLREAKILAKAMDAAPIDAVIHLAALAGVQPSISDPKSYFEVNVQGTLNLFEICKDRGIGAIAAASSSSVYGNNKKIPFAESDPVNLPISPYAASKRAGELLAYTYHHLHGMSIACLRFFTVYGPRQRPDLAIYKFCRAILRGEPITLYGDGSSSRDYTYIEDCVQGILQASDWTQSAAAVNEARYDIFNLGEDQSVPLETLVKLLETYLNTKAKRHYADYLAGDVYATRADLEHSRQTLAYQPKIKIEEGLRRFCDWFLAEEQHQPWVTTQK